MISYSRRGRRHGICTASGHLGKRCPRCGRGMKQEVVRKPVRRGILGWFKDIVGRRPTMRMR